MQEIADCFDLNYETSSQRGRGRIKSGCIITNCFYAYVGNNPINATDPNGLLARSVANTVSSYYGSASDWAGTKATNLGQSLRNTAEYGLFKTDSEMTAWGEGLRSAAQQGTTADFLRNPGNLPGSVMKDVAGVAATLGGASLGRAGATELLSSRGGMNLEGGFLRSQ